MKAARKKSSTALIATIVETLVPSEIPDLALVIADNEKGACAWEDLIERFGPSNSEICAKQERLQRLVPEEYHAELIKYFDFEGNISNGYMDAAYAIGVQVGLRLAARGAAR